jgi:pimeloyl-ACP methyl ester carboxylesterase
MPSAIRERALETPGGRFAVLEAGPDDGTPAICLHGFPDSAWTWRYLLPALGRCGLHAVAPFMRGYAPTELPPNGRYAIDDLADDASALHEAIGTREQGVLIGHDWGAAAVYSALRRSRDRWRCAVASSVPPAGGFSIDAISLAQLRRSWYSFLFQLPDASVPERLAAQNDLGLVDSLWADWSPGYDAAEDVRLAKRALRPPGRLRAAIAYYREAATGIPTREEAAAAQRRLRDLDAPLLYVHGADDGCIGLDSVELVRPNFPSSAEVVVLEGVGHFIHLERPEEFNHLVLDFVTASG